MQANEGSFSPVPIVVAILVVLGLCFAMFGAKIWYDKKRITEGTSNVPSRASAYDMKDDEDIDQSNP